jgi:hypothetical protein
MSLGLPQHIAVYGIGQPAIDKVASDLAGQFAPGDVIDLYKSAL